MCHYSLICCRTVVDSRVSQLSQEFHTVQQQNKMEVEKLRKQLDEERSKAQKLAAKVKLSSSPLSLSFFFLSEAT